MGKGACQEDKEWDALTPPFGHPSFDAFYDFVSCVETHTSCVQSRLYKLKWGEGSICPRVPEVRCSLVILFERIECHHEEAGGRRGDLFLFQRVMELLKIKLDIIQP